MKFGIFLAPFHRVGENPTLAIDRDMELIEWLDHLGYDGPNVEAIRKAYADAGRPVPKEFLSRTTGGADAGPIVPGGS